MILKSFNICLFIYINIFVFNVKNENSIKLKNKNKQSQILKSFTASCSEYGENIGFCRYSVGFYSNPNGGDSTSYDANAIILNDNIAESYRISVQLNNPKYINFDVQAGDLIEIQLNLLIAATPYIPYFEVYAYIDGQGPIIQTSKDTNRIQITNTCTSDVACTFTMDSVTTYQDWIDSSSYSLLCINYDLITTFSGSLLDFQAFKGDIITIILPTIDPIYRLQMIISNDLRLIIFKWFSNAYYTPMLLRNYCILHLPAPPFGKKLYPIDSEQLQEFLIDHSSPISTRWVELGADSNEYENTSSED